MCCVESMYVWIETPITHIQDFKLVILLNMYIFYKKKVIIDDGHHQHNIRAQGKKNYLHIERREGVKKMATHFFLYEKKTGSGNSCVYGNKEKDLCFFGTAPAHSILLTHTPIHIHTK